MNWYVVQLTIGSEEQFLLKAKNRFDKTICQDYLLLRNERLKKLGGRWIVQRDILFPGYIFIKTETPKELKRYLQTANMGRILEGSRDEFIALEKEEEQLILSLTRGNQEPVIRLTDIWLSDTGLILHMNGILERFSNYIQKVNLRKRFALVNIPVAGKERTILFGLRLEKDRVKWEPHYEFKENERDKDQTYSRRS